MLTDPTYPTLQHHIANALWSFKLRPLQDRAITPIVDGLDAILLAPDRRWQN